MYPDQSLVRGRPLAQAVLLLFLAPALASGCRTPGAGGGPTAPPAFSAPPESADAWTPEHAGWVTDLGELLTPDEERQLAGILQAYRDETGHELAVLTVPGLRGEAIESFSQRVARSWGLGRVGIDDGLLVASPRASAGCASRWATG